jgi:hypothetical protein
MAGVVVPTQQSGAGNLVKQRWEENFTGEGGRTAAHVNYK